MANQEHLDILKQGTLVWGDWRDVSPIRVLPDLSGADLYYDDLREADLSYADLSGANLMGADLSGADLSGADLKETIVGLTSFGNVDLSVVKNLETVLHLRPSSIGIDTIIRSHGKIPEIFLRGAGVPDSIIEAIPSLIGSLSPIDYYSCFISYSSKDQYFPNVFMLICKAKVYVVGLRLKTSKSVTNFDLALTSQYGSMISCFWYSLNTLQQVNG